MEKETFDDCHACINAVSELLAGHSLDIIKVVLLALLRDVLVTESSSPEMLAMRADQVADYIMGGGREDV